MGSSTIHSVKKELPAILSGNSEFVKNLAELERQVVSRVDDVDYSMLTLPSTSRSFAAIFYNPGLLCRRSKVCKLGSDMKNF